MDIPTYETYRELIVSNTFGPGYERREHDGRIIHVEPYLSPFEEKKIYNMYVDKYLKTKKAVFITLQDFKRREEDFEKLKFFCKNIEYIFDDFAWIIESGKAVPLNLHVHILGIINNKNAKRAIKIEYNKIFGDDITEKDYYHVKQWRNSNKMPPYHQWLSEKLDYFKNNLKGDHENTIDYTDSGGYGVSGRFLLPIIKTA